MSHVYCPDCGFQNPEAANYCARCGALLAKQESAEATMTFVPEEAAEEAGQELERLGVDGPALVVRSGGGRAGETFVLEKDEGAVISGLNAGDSTAAPYLARAARLLGTPAALAALEACAGSAADEALRAVYGAELERVVGD